VLGATHARRYIGRGVPSWDPSSLRYRTFVARPDVRAGLVAFAAVALLGFNGGGYTDGSWPWAIVGLAAVAALARLGRKDPVFGELEVICLSALALLAAWILASGAWGIAGTEAPREAGRAVLYLAGLAAFLSVTTLRSAKGLLVGVLCVTTALAAYGLGERALRGPAQDPFEGNLLVEPLGYANALGIVCAVGLVVASGIVLDDRRRRVVASAIGVAAVLGTALVLTSSRGAWLSVAIGLGTLGAVRWRPTTGRGGRCVLIAALGATAVALWLTLSLGSSFGDREQYWRAAVADAEQHAILGSGAGSFDDYWYAHSNTTSVRDAHSLYLETIAELGPAGVLLLLVALVTPLAAVVVGRSHPAVPVAAGAYMAFLFHAGLDWDWEMPATTLTGLACAALLLAAARPERGTSRPV